MTRIAINGMGRIGRATLKILQDHPELELVAVNDIAPLENLAYLLKHDSAYGKYHKEVAADGDNLKIGQKEHRFLSEKDPAKLPWRDLGVDIAIECTGFFTKGEDLQRHIHAGAKHAMLSAPAKSEDVPTFVYGATKLPDPPPQVLSCASCTTNCITPIVEVLDRRIGLAKATMTTVHAYTSTQQIVDSPSKKVRRGRAGAVNMVPTSTGAAQATSKALPQFEGRFNGAAIRVPVPVGSIADIVCVTKRRTSAEEINRIFFEEADGPRYNEVLGVSEDPIVSTDIIADPRAAVVDAEMTQVVDGDLVKIMGWYDNEWGYAAQLVRQATSLAKSLV